jgi:hypothetical protein
MQDARSPVVASQLTDGLNAHPKSFELVDFVHVFPLEQVFNRLFGDYSTGADRSSKRFGSKSPATGDSRCGGAVSATGGRGSGSRFLWPYTCPDSELCTLTLWPGFAPSIRDKTRVRQQRSHGSVRGVPGNWHPYRDRYITGGSSG